MLFAFFGLVSLGSVSAQSCSKSAKTAGKSCAKSCAKTTAAAAKLASMDESIEERVCAKSGSVSYARKAVCAKSGKVSYEDVKYCSDSKKFVNVSPSATKEAKAVQMSTTAKKKSCAKSCAKSCSKGKSVKATTTTKVGEAKLVKQEEQ